MSREIAAGALRSVDQLLLLSRHVPERSLPELLSSSARVGDPVRLALLHVRVCDDCAGASLCERGARLIEACHAWQPRR